MFLVMPPYHLYFFFLLVLVLLLTWSIPAWTFLSLRCFVHPTPLHFFSDTRRFLFLWTFSYMGGLTRLSGTQPLFSHLVILGMCLGASVLSCDSIFSLENDVLQAHHPLFLCRWELTHFLFPTASPVRGFVTPPGGFRLVRSFSNVFYLFFGIF